MIDSFILLSLVMFVQTIWTSHRYANVIEILQEKIVSKGFRVIRKQKNDNQGLISIQTIPTIDPDLTFDWIIRQKKERLVNLVIVCLSCYCSSISYCLVLFISQKSVIVHDVIEENIRRRCPDEKKNEREFN